MSTDRQDEAVERDDIELDLFEIEVVLREASEVTDEDGHALLSGELHQACVHKLPRVVAALSRLQQAREEGAAAVDALRAKLGRYGRHELGCGAGIFRGANCTCGFAPSEPAALAETEEPKP